MATGGGVLEVVRAELVADAQVKVSGGGAAWFSGDRVSIQKVDCGNSSPRRRHQVRADFREIRPVSVTVPLAIHLKYLCHWEGRIIKPMLVLQRGVEFSKVVVEESHVCVSHVAGPDIFLHST